MSGARCPNCGKADWPLNFEPVLTKVGDGCPACNPDFAESVP
jgi:uncharacterized protein (DUF983 family)